jgi:glycosyltransferase involved in cell wall biosynthesis
VLEREPSPAFAACGEEHDLVTRRERIGPSVQVWPDWRISDAWPQFVTHAVTVGATAGTAKIRVLQVVWRLSLVGGVPAVVRTLLTGLDPERFEAHVLSLRPLLDEDELDSLGPHVHLHTLDHPGKRSIPRLAPLALRMVGQVRRIDPDVIHTHVGTAWMSALAAVMRPATVRVLDLHEPPFGVLLGRWSSTAETAMMRFAGYHPVAHSSSVRIETGRLLQRSVESISYIPLGVDPVPLNPLGGQEFRRTFGIPADHKIVLYSGSSPNKNVRLFTQVARDVLDRLTQVTFVLLAPGDVSDAGPIPEGMKVCPFQPSIIPALLASDIFLSTADYEGWGIAITEAMYTGVPVVSTAVGGVTDQVVDGVTGFLTPEGERDLLVDRTMTLLTDDDMRRRMGSAARGHVEDKFMNERMVRSFEDLYDRLVSDKREACGRTGRRPG